MGRDRIAMVRMTDEEAAKLRAEAERRGLKLGTFLRMVALEAVAQAPGSTEPRARRKRQK